MDEQTPLEDLPDRAVLLRIARGVEHVDVMVHEVHNLAMRAAPWLDRLGGGAFKRALSGKAARHG